MNDGWSQLMQNPRSIVLKKFIAQILGAKVNNYDDVITRISSVLVTDNDVKMFGDMVNDVINTGYRKAIDDYKEQLKEFDIEVSLKN